MRPGSSQPLLLQGWPGPDSPHEAVSDQVTISFLGGLGEIGRNCACFELNGRIVVLDCGIMFPDPDMPGIDLVLPDLSYLRERADQVDAVVLTHGHEDHTGGLAYLLRDLSTDVSDRRSRSGSRATAIEEAGLIDRARFIEVHDGERRQVGPFDVEFIPVTHSVPHGFATAFHTPQGVILHSGDFKLDLTPVDGRRTDLARIGSIADNLGHPPACCRTRPTPRSRGSRNPRCRSAQHCGGSSRAGPGDGSSSRASPATSTGSSR